MSLLRKTSLAAMSPKRRARLAADGTVPWSTFSPGSALTRKPRSKRSRRPADSGPDEATVRLVWGHDQGCCVRCGTILWPAGRGFGWSVHHRVLKSHGVNNSPTNLILLCGSGSSGCHGMVHSRPRTYRAEGGWILRSTDNPAQVAVLLAGSRWVYLTVDGRYADKPAGAAA